MDAHLYQKAVRAKELAEKKMNSNDYVGARILLDEVQKLCPDVENVTRMLTVCEVHCSAESKEELGSDLDWYAILQIEQTAGEAFIKKQFRQLALQLHPDKNKFPGAEAAFQFVKEAEMILCDQSKRSQFDMKREVMKQRQSQSQPSMNNCPSQNSVSTDFASVIKRMESDLEKQQQANGQQTFWTQCPFCATRYQYYIDVMNRNLLCQRCREAFVASNNHGMPYRVNSRPVPPKKDAPSQDDQKIQGNRGNVAPVSQAPTVSGRAPKPNAEEDVNVHVEVEMKEKSVPAEPTTLGTKNRKRGRNSVTEKETEGLETESSCDMEEDCDHEAGQNSGLNNGRDTRRSSWRKHDVSYKENLGDEDDTASRSRRKTTKISEPVDKVKKDKREVLEESTPDGSAGNCKNNGEEVSKDDENSEGPEPVVAEVVYPCFYDFDRDRTEECFALDQIWAIFDGSDGMPRFYARINKVHSPFKVDLTWLEFVAGDPDQTAWKTGGLPFACGNFKHEKTDTVKDIGTFSHKMVCQKGVQDTYKIYPQKLETWALYKNWNIKWSSDRDYHREYEYEFVVVLSDYNESGILVAQLVKLKGFECSFKATETNGMYTFQIPSNEMLKFSHRVPSVRTNGYFELDPDSVSSNLEEVPDFIDGEAEILGARKHCSLKSILKKKPHVPKNVNEENVEESKKLSTSDGVKAKDEILGGRKHRSLHSILKKNPHVPKNGNEENVEQIASSPSSFIDPCQLPESVLHSFEDDRSEDKFQAGQVWALYCELDGLPKYYGRIKKVESIPEFKVNIQWLEACTPPKGMLKWLGNNMPTCCGVFSTGDEREFDDTAYFSHLSKAAEVVKGNKVVKEYTYEVFPRKGEVWAIYRNFSSEWSSSDLQTCKYDIGKVVNVEGTIKVLVLEKLSDYKTIFKVRRKADHDCIIGVPQDELLRFSHQIPAIQLTDEKVRTLLTDEKLGILRGCWKLDPKAMPVCLFNRK